MKRYILIIALLALCGFSPKVFAQWLPYYPEAIYRVADEDTLRNVQNLTLELPKVEPHLSVGTGFMGTSYGDNRLYTSVAPSLVYRPSKKWTLMGGFRITTDMGLNPNYPFGSGLTDLAPYRRNGGTGLVSGGVRAQYQVNDNVWLAGSVYHIGGTYAPLYFGNGNVYDVSCTAISAEAAFRFANNNFLHVSFTYLNDQQGTLPYMMHDAWMHCGGYGGWGFYATPADYYRMAAFGPMCHGYGF